jgi:hypothetical protein
LGHLLIGFELCDETNNIIMNICNNLNLFGDKILILSRVKDFKNKYTQIAKIKTYILDVNLMDLSGSKKFHKYSKNEKSDTFKKIVNRTIEVTKSEKSTLWT